MATGAGPFFLAAHLPRGGDSTIQSRPTRRRVVHWAPARAVAWQLAGRVAAQSPASWIMRCDLRLASAMPRIARLPRFLAHADV